MVFRNIQQIFPQHSAHRITSQIQGLCVRGCGLRQVGLSFLHSPFQASGGVWTTGIVAGGFSSLCWQACTLPHTRLAIC